MTPGPGPRLRDLIADAEAVLSGAGVDSARADAELLAAHAAGTDRSRLAVLALIGRISPDLKAALALALIVAGVIATTILRARLAVLAPIGRIGPDLKAAPALALIVAGAIATTIPLVGLAAAAPIGRINPDLEAALEPAPIAVAAANVPRDSAIAVTVLIRRAT